MTSREIFNSYKGYIESENRRIKSDWEQTRWLGTQILKPYSKKKNLKPEDLGRFSWEDEGENLEDEIEKIKERRKWRQAQ